MIMDIQEYKIFYNKPQIEETDFRSGKERRRDRRKEERNRNKNNEKRRY